jgi:hypothetical protein
MVTVAMPRSQEHVEYKESAESFVGQYQIMPTPDSTGNYRDWSNNGQGSSRAGTTSSSNSYHNCSSSSSNDDVTAADIMPCGSSSRSSSNSSTLSTWPAVLRPGLPVREDDEVIMTASNCACTLNADASSYSNSSITSSPMLSSSTSTSADGHHIAVTSNQTDSSHYHYRQPLEHGNGVMHSGNQTSARAIEHEQSFDLEVRIPL